jgi:hypothetical protein
MQRRQAQRDGYVHTLEAEVSRLRAAGEAEAEAAAASLQRTHALEAELVLLRHAPPQQRRSPLPASSPAEPRR